MHRLTLLLVTLFSLHQVSCVLNRKTEAAEKRIGPHGIPVPAACFKALLIRNGARWSAIGFVMRKGGEERSVEACACMVDELEALLGLDLFYALPDDLEEAAEGRITWSDWN